jgi:hypothetical protein
LHEYFQGVSDEALQAVWDMHRSPTTPPARLFMKRMLLKEIGFVLAGGSRRYGSIARAEVAVPNDRSRRQFGLMIGALSEPVPLRIVALEPSAVLLLDYGRALELTLQYHDLRRLWLTTFAGNLRKHYFGAAPRRAPMMLALIHDSPATRRLAERLAGRLCELGETLAVFSDTDKWGSLPDVRHHPIHLDGRELNWTRFAGRLRVARRQPHHHRRPCGPRARFGEKVDGNRRSGHLLCPSSAGRRRPPLGRTRYVTPAGRQDQRRLAAG